MLVRQVLADPLDAAARGRLRELRQRRDRERRTAYAALADGLGAYLDAGPAMAADALERASRCPQAVWLAGSLPRPLAVLLAESHAAARRALAGRKKVCTRCGGTGRADCRAHRCHASGKVPCPRCKGTGAVRKTLPGFRGYAYVACPDCDGMGVSRCEECEGTGTVPCPACGKHAGAAAPAPIVPLAEEQAIRQVICKARRLSRGEIDLYTAGALTPSPK
jgi:hypothetical protein